MHILSISFFFTSNQWENWCSSCVYCAISHLFLLVLGFFLLKLAAIVVTYFFFFYLFDHRSNRVQVIHFCYSCPQNKHAHQQHNDAEKQPALWTLSRLDWILLNFFVSVVGSMLQHRFEEVDQVWIEGF